MADTVNKEVLISPFSASSVFPELYRETMMGE